MYANDSPLKTWHGFCIFILYNNLNLEKMKSILIKENDLKDIIYNSVKEVIDNNKCIMEKYYGILSNKYNPQPISESSVDRILNKHGNAGMAIISANRSDADNRTNNEKTKELIKDLKDSGFTYIPVYGGYHGSDDVVDEYEPSFVVTCFDRNGEKQNIKKLFNFAIEMCGKYNQDSVLFKAPNQSPNYYDRNGAKVNTSSTNDVIKNDPTQEFFTSLIKTNKLDKENPERSKRFTYDIQFENKTYGIYLNPKPTTLNERMRRTKSGEIIL